MNSNAGESERQSQRRIASHNRASISSQASLRKGMNGNASKQASISEMPPNSVPISTGVANTYTTKQLLEQAQQSHASTTTRVQSMSAQQTYNKNETHTHMYKIVLVGDAGVGKTHIINRYVKGQLPPAIIPTIGIEFATKTVTLRDGGSIKTQIWDTAGQEKYRSITSAHYRKAVGAMLVYDVTKSKSFESIQRWLKEIRLHADPQIVLFLVGNKVDLVNQSNTSGVQRGVSKDDAATFAKENGLLFEESSALHDVNITDAFERLLEEIYDKKQRIQSERSLANVMVTESEEQQQQGGSSGVGSGTAIGYRKNNSNHVIDLKSNNKTGGNNGGTMNGRDDSLCGCS